MECGERWGWFGELGYWSAIGILFSLGMTMEVSELNEQVPEPPLPFDGDMAQSGHTTPLPCTVGYPRGRWLNGVTGSKEWEGSSLIMCAPPDVGTVDAYSPAIPFSVLTLMSMTSVPAASDMCVLVAGFGEESWWVFMPVPAEMPNIVRMKLGKMLIAGRTRRVVVKRMTSTHPLSMKMVSVMAMAVTSLGTAMCVTVMGMTRIAYVIGYHIIRRATLITSVFCEGFITTLGMWFPGWLGTMRRWNEILHPLVTMFPRSRKKVSE